jgi:hypothetical protein
MNKVVLFILFVLFSYLVFMLTVSDRNFETFRLDPTGKYYNPY